MITGMTTSAFANAEETVALTQQEEQTTLDDVLSLKPYVAIKENGTLELDAVKALENGSKEDAVESLQCYFKILNKEINDGVISVAEDLTIIGGEVEIATHYCSRGVNRVSQYWWGWQRKACNCESNKIAHDFTAISQGNGIAAGSSSLLSMLLGAVFPPAVPITSILQSKT